MQEAICKLEQGQLRGFYDKDLDNNPFMNFLGIPYAKAPLGKLRFKPPQPPDSWPGIRDATREGPPCYSSQVMLGGLISRLKLMGSEDCLFVNVFTRQLFKDNHRLKPVMVWIHGGAFFTGSSHRDYYGPHHLMVEDIVLVTFNYRLGILGFLVMDDSSLDVTGNIGLKDQLFLLKWVQKNIAHFNGDPSNVTIFGQNAGSVSVNLLLLLPSAKGLFHKAIMQSGVVMCPWGRGINDFAKIANELDCKESDDKKILEFLQNIPVKTLIEAQNKFLLKNPDGTKPSFWGPHVEAIHKYNFLKEEPYQLMSSGSYNQVPIMMGYTSMEGIFDTWGFFRLNKKLRNFVPDYFGCATGAEDTLKIHRKITKFYFEDHHPSVFKKAALAKVLTDVEFLRPILFAVKTFAKTSRCPVYFYRMSVETKLNVFTKMLGLQHKGVCHYDDCFYLFSSKYTDFRKETIEDLSVRRFVRLWANFAKTGNPTPNKDELLEVEWKPVCKEQLNFLDIDRELAMGVDPDNDRMQFWDNISCLAHDKQYVEMFKFVNSY